MPKVKTESLQPGMVVSADVKNMDNMLLMPAGCELTEKHITVLSAWGVADIEVENSGAPEETADILQTLDPEVLHRITDALQAVFWEPVDSNPIQREVFELILRRKARQLLS